MKVEFCSLSSGSSGNCYYIGNEFHGILVDAGISASSIRKYLKQIDISLQSIMGILVTHNHTDHIKGLEVLTRKSHIPVFTTANVWKSILSPHMNISADCIREIKEQQEFNLAGFAIEAFRVSHDAPETVGYSINFEGVIITIATDLGYICETSSQYIRNANLLVIESNYDEQMLMEGSYPYYLKKRIKSDSGHLGNHQTSDFLAEIYNDRLSYVCLAHLSKNNNTPELALSSLYNKFNERGVGISNSQHVMVLSRNNPSEKLILHTGE